MEKFIVSARKYRPLTFESVVGQNHITSTLKNAILRKQVAHAYLFCGPRGVGKTTCARILSKSINCLNPQESGEACGECESCKAFAESRSFNIHELDAASNNSVENIRSLNEQVRIQPQIGKYSIYIIDEAHMLSTAAFNAFLKTLEEPPAHAIFILATTEKHKILPTILSRCQIYDFKRIRIEDMVEFLRYISEKESVSCDDESLHIIASKADGCMRDALSMYDKVVSFCGQNLEFHAVSEALNVLDYDSYFRFVDFYRSGDYKSALVQFDSIMQKGFEALTFLAGLSSHLRNLLVASDPQTISILEVTGTLAARYTAQAREISAATIFDSLNIISQSEQSAKSTLNIRLHAEITILKLCNLAPQKISAQIAENNYKVVEAASAQPQQAVQQQVAQPQSQPQQRVQPQPQPQSRVQPQPVAQQQPVAPPQTQQQVQPKPQPAAKSSLLGVSISNMLKNEPQSEQQEVKKNDNQEFSNDITISPESQSKVLEGCREFAESLTKNRPRLADAFSRCKFVDGKLVVTVPNNILSEELNSERHTVIEHLIPFCRVQKLNFEIEVDQTVESERKVLLKDEDKLDFLRNSNPNVMKVCHALNLDFI